MNTRPVNPRAVRFTLTQRIGLFLAAGGRCQQCGRELRRGWHADHVIPRSKGGPTVVENGRATCGKCNLKKGAAVTKPLHRWQERYIARYFTAAQRDFLLVATPGAGKTRVAAEIARQSFVGSRVDRLIVVVPTIPLRVQWASVLAENGRHVDPGWKVGDLIPPDVDGLVITYAAVASNPMVLRRLATEKRTLVVFDEVHHCGDDDHLAWGPSLVGAFEQAAWRLSLSGTPFRSDSARIPFVTYVDGEAVIDARYGYQEAVTDGVCRVVFFPTLGGRMEWKFGDLDEVVQIQDAKPHQERHALRTAIMADGGWVAQTLDDAHRKLTETRLTDPDAAGLIVCDNIAHAGQMARALRTSQRLSEQDVVLVSHEDEQSPQIIRAFRDSKAMWIVAVRMVSEGVDIPRIRVIVWATAEKTEMKFRQIMGRSTRVESDHDDHTAWMFLPADRELLEWASRIAEERAHALREDEEKMTGGANGHNGDRPVTSFTPVSSQGRRGDTITADGKLTEAELAQAETVKGMSPTTATLPTEQLALFLRNMMRADGPQAQPTGNDEPAPHERREALRIANNKAAAAIGMRWGIRHDEVNARLNRSVGVSGITGATIEQLEQRLRLAANWRDSGEALGVAA